jgi:RNA polymerase sigma-70 factor (ECF subfamily)
LTKPDASTQALFRELFDAEYDYVYHSLRRLGVQQRDLEDVAHDVFVAVYENLARYDRARPIKPWLFAFAFRFASDYRRLARHRTELGVPDDAAPPSGRSGSVEDDVARREAAALIASILEAMPIDQRAVFVLYEIDETPMKEIAAALDIPVNTAYSRLRLAREVFRGEVEKQQKREGGGR